MMDPGEGAGSEQPERPDVFVSYARTDHRFVGDLAYALRNNKRLVAIVRRDVEPARLSD